MKTLKVFTTLLIFSILFSCKKKTDVQYSYVFVKPYCATVTVGGVVGIAQRCFAIGDIVQGKQAENGTITIRIAGHTALNDGPPSSASYQEFLDVPAEHLKLN